MCKNGIDKQTFGASIEFHPQGNVFVPAPRMNFNVLGFDSREKSMLNNAVLISVSLEVLKGRTACRGIIHIYSIFLSESYSVVYNNHVE